MVIECGATRYDRRECDGPPSFDVVYTSRDGRELDRHAACFRHGLAEVDRHAAAAGAARAEMVAR